MMVIDYMNSYGALPTKPDQTYLTYLPDLPSYLIYLLICPIHTPDFSLAGLWNDWERFENINFLNRLLALPKALDIDDPDKTQIRDICCHLKKGGILENFASIQAL